jgi:hypothetical protein
MSLVYPLVFAPVAGLGGLFMLDIGLLVPIGKSLEVLAGGVFPPATEKFGR